MPKWPEITWISSNKKDSPKILGINPWIYDFAAYNFWARPVGLISCLCMLESAGCDVALLDCMYPMWKDVKWPKQSKYGTGPYPRTEIPKPSELLHVPRKFARYGLDFNAVYGALKNLSPPDFVMVSCVMTYWYPGLMAIIELIRKLFKSTKIIAGGIYPSLCTNHAEKYLDADLIIRGPMETEDNWKLVTKFIGISGEKANFRLSSKLYPNPGFSIILGSRGCPFSCEYCASKRLYSSFKQRPLQDIYGEFLFDYNRGIRDFVFYDDALLFKPENWFLPFLEKVIKNNHRVRFHTPNGLHIRYLEKDICILMKKAGFKTIRLGLETGNFKTRLDKKLTKEQWDIGVENLLEAGFDKKDIGVYILFGLPGERDGEVVSTIAFAKSYGFRPHLAYYTPIPGSKLFEKAKSHSPYPIDEDPIFQNNAIWPCYPGGFSWEKRAYFREVMRPG
ncbi:B12-binding domain-containing radical SAM protein [Desulfothermus okinawensis JCM 13304]